MKRLLDVIKLLTSQNVVLRGHDETPNSNNSGKCLAVLYFLAKYDPIINSHLSSLLNNPKSVSYLAHDVQNEFISLMVKHVRNQIVAEIKASTYYGIMFYPTSDISHSAQLSEVIRYVKIDYNTSTVDIREAFSDFITIDKKDAVAYEHVIRSKLQVDTLNFDDCRSQMYDNAAVMSGYLIGVQARLVDKNPKAAFCQLL